MATTAAQLQQRILNFWLRGNPSAPNPTKWDLVPPVTSSAPAPKERFEMWFISNPEFDDECRNRFKETLEDIRKGGSKDLLDELKQTPEGTLSAIILLDQFPRNIYRKTATPFRDFDPIALETARQAIAKGYDEQMSLNERNFVYLPYGHSESVDDQNVSVAKAEEMVAQASEPFKGMCEEILKYAKEHRGVVQRFGRFPHRNEVLERKSTKEEEEYLVDANRYGQ